MHGFLGVFFSKFNLKRKKNWFLPSNDAPYIDWLPVPSPGIKRDINKNNISHHNYSTKRDEKKSQLGSFLSAITHHLSLSKLFNAKKDNYRYTDRVRY